jgi:hypothetical protein
VISPATVNLRRLSLHRRAAENRRKLQHPPLNQRAWWITSAGFAAGAPTRPRSSPLRLDPQASPDSASRSPVYLASSCTLDLIHTSEVPSRKPHLFQHQSSTTRFAPKRQEDFTYASAVPKCYNLKSNMSSRTSSGSTSIGITWLTSHQSQ